MRAKAGIQSPNLQRPNASTAVCGNTGSSAFADDDSGEENCPWLDAPHQPLVVFASCLQRPWSENRAGESSKAKPTAIAKVVLPVAAFAPKKCPLRAWNRSKWLLSGNVCCYEATVL
jgi:hypothetical protein